MTGNFMFLFGDVAEEGTKEHYTVIRKARNTVCACYPLQTVILCFVSFSQQTPEL